MSVLNYSKPPINEVVIGVQFPRITALLPPHLGLFWQSIRADYPGCQHAAPLIGADGQPWFDATVGVILPRVWFVSKDDIYVVQVQNDRFLCSWRKRGSADTYPRFPSIKQRFMGLYTLWTRFTQETLGVALVPSAAEVSYINVIGKSDGWVSWDRLGELLPDFVWSRPTDRFLLAPSSGSAQMTFPVSGTSAILTVRINEATRVDDKEDVLRLELTTQTPLSEDAVSQLSTWYDLARENIVRGFADLTSERVQKDLWGREDA